MEIISLACWNSPCTTAWPCGMEKGAEGLIHQGVTKGGSKEGESASEAAGDQALGDRAAAAYKHKRKLKLPVLSGFS